MVQLDLLSGCSHRWVHDNHDLCSSHRSFTLSRCFHPTVAGWPMPPTSGGRYEVYVQPFPSLIGKWQISTEGGPRTGLETEREGAVYRNGGKMMVVDVATQSGFHAAKPRMLFEGHYVADKGRQRNYDVTPDGQRFVMVKPSEQESAATQINVVLNWFEDLKRRVGPGAKH